MADEDTYVDGLSDETDYPDTELEVGEVHCRRLDHRIQPAVNDRGEPDPQGMCYACWLEIQSGDFVACDLHGIQPSEKGECSVCASSPPEIRLALEESRRRVRQPEPEPDVEPGLFEDGMGQERPVQPPPPVVVPHLPGGAHVGRSVRGPRRGLFAAVVAGVAPRDPLPGFQAVLRAARDASRAKMQTVREHPPERSVPDAGDGGGTSDVAEVEAGS